MNINSLDPIKMMLLQWGDIDENQYTRLNEQEKKNLYNQILEKIKEEKAARKEQEEKIFRLASKKEPFLEYKAYQNEQMNDDDDYYWNLFNAWIGCIPANAKTVSGETLDNFLQNPAKVSDLYMNTYGWVDQDLEGFGLIGNLQTALTDVFPAEVVNVTTESFIKKFDQADPERKKN